MLAVLWNGNVKHPKVGPRVTRASPISGARSGDRHPDPARLSWLTIVLQTPPNQRDLVVKRARIF